MNQVQLIGNITRDIQLEYTNSNIAFCKFTIGVGRKFKDKQTNEYKSDFIRIVAWKQTAEYLSKNAHKGTKVSVVGRIETGQYENELKGTVYTTDVIASEVQILERKQYASDEQREVYNETNGGRGRERIEVDSEMLPF